jgi:xylitol oxidase
MELRNWAGNIRFSTDRVHHPETVGQVQEIVRKSRQVRVLGARIPSTLSPIRRVT